jgi:hypothetical protein
MVLCNAYGLTGDAKLEAPARALEFVVNAQHTGGGGRTPRDNPATRR